MAIAPVAVAGGGRAGRAIRLSERPLSREQIARYEDALRAYLRARREADRSRHEELRERTEEVTRLRMVIRDRQRQVRREVLD
jgi:hypothetical protein